MEGYREPYNCVLLSYCDDLRLCVLTVSEIGLFMYLLLSFQSTYPVSWFLFCNTAEGYVGTGKALTAIEINYMASTMNLHELVLPFNEI